MSKSQTKSEKILAQIEELKLAAKQAALAEREARQRVITRAARRTGLDDLGLAEDALIDAFHRIVSVHSDRSTISAPAATDDVASAEDDADGWGVAGA